MSSEEIWFSRSAVPERGSLVLCGSRLHQQRQGMTQPFLPALYRRPPNSLRSLTPFLRCVPRFRLRRSLHNRRWIRGLESAARHRTSIMESPGPTRSSHSGPNRIENKHFPPVPGIILRGRGWPPYLRVTVPPIQGQAGTRAWSRGRDTLGNKAPSSPFGNGREDRIPSLPLRLPPCFDTTYFYLVISCE